MEEVPEFGAVFTFGRSRFGENNANKFWVKSDPVNGVACGDEHTAVVTSTGRVYTFGSNQWGQLALGHTKQTNKPSFVKSLKGKKVVKVACGRSHTLLATESEVFACGANGENQVNGSEDDEVLSPYSLLTGITVKRLSCGVEHSLLLDTKGEVYMWGSGSEGQLGMGDSVLKLLKPTQLQFTKEEIRDASCGYYHTALVTQSGKVFSFGESEAGKLGVGEDPNDAYFTPQPVFFVDSAEKVCCGNNCTAVVTSAGALFMCGDGQRGQLGFSPASLNKCVYTFTKVPCPPVAAVSLGEGHTAVVSKTGHLYTFGDGRHGKLCHGEDAFSNLHSPHLVETFSMVATVSDVACGGCHTMVVAKPGKPPTQDVRISGARSKRHLRGGTITTKDVDLNKENCTPTIMQENVKSLESALVPEKQEEIVKINSVEKEPNTDNTVTEKKESEVKKKEEKEAPEKKKEEKEVPKKQLPPASEDSGSETDEPGATSEVTDSEESEEEDEEGESGGLMENVMSIDDLQPASAPSPPASTITTTTTTSGSTPITVKPKQGTKEEAVKNKTEEKKVTTAGEKKVSEERKETTTVSEEVESSDYVTETDEEGETEDETEEDEAEEATENQIKTLVNSGTEPRGSTDITKMEVSEGPSTDSAAAQAPGEKSVAAPAKTNVEKTPSKFKFWKKKKKPDPVISETPGTHHNSRTCTIL